MNNHVKIGRDAVAGHWYKELRTHKLSIWVKFYLIGLLVPAIINLGPLRLSFYRIVLLILFLPLVLRWLSQINGRIIFSDIMILMYTIWLGVSLLVNHGIDEMWQFAGITSVEALGSYLLARMYIKNIQDFYKFVQFLFALLLILLPIAALETFFGYRLVNDAVAIFADTFSWHTYTPRLGMNRAQGPFEHPILFGVFTSTSFALFYFHKSKGSKEKPWMLGAFVSGAITFFCLSMGAYISVFFQMLLIAWDKGLKRIRKKWNILFFSIVSVYVALDLLSNQSPAALFVNTFTFNSHTAYFRIHIWNYAVENVLQNPFFGLGLQDWVRPSWMPPSIDNFWLVTAVQFGLPGLIFLTTAFVTMIYRVSRAPITDQHKRNIRKGFIFALLGVSVAISTVHLWNATYSFLLFFLGCGMGITQNKYKSTENPKTSGK